MELKSLEDMRKFEVFSDYKIVEDCFFVIRVDGKGFHNEVKKMNLARPFDRRLNLAMSNAIKSVMKEFGCVFAYTESDEASFLFSDKNVIFDRRIEKLLSLVASKMSVEFGKSPIARTKGVSAIFDARIVLLPNKDAVVKYFIFRGNDCYRNAISSTVFFNLVKSGKNVTEATRIMEEMKNSEKNELLFKEFGINFNNLPDYEKKGTMFYIKSFKKKGFNPIKNEKVIVTRTKIVSEDVKVKFLSDNLDKYINKGIKII